MQATLLGLATAMILALIAALVGPHFVDWTQYRARFETEATRVAGMPVRIAGPIDVRLLPTPTLSLGRVEFGNPTQPHAKVRELYAELALGSLVRGEWRASDVRLVGPDATLAIAANGKLDWSTRIGVDPDQLQIEKVSIEDGRIALRDGASGIDTALEGFWFKGDLRSLLGPVKGEGGFILAKERFAYRLATSRVADDGMKIRLALDPSDYPLALEAEGTMRLEDSAPRFEGTMTLARPVAVAGATGRGTVAVPWRALSKVKATPAQALFEQLEYQYGPDARAIKLGGTASLRFGKAPRFEGVISARQVDLDRGLALPEASGRLPLAALKAFIEPLASSWRPPFPVRLGIGVDAVTLAAGTLQNLRGDISLDGNGWDIEQLEFRAPGYAQVRLSGRIASAMQGGVSFTGPAQIESSDPKAFLGWLEGRQAVQRQAGLLRVGGELTIGTQAFAVEKLKFEFDRKTIEGRFAYAAGDNVRAPRLDAELKAGDLDVDGVLAFARAASDGAAFERPRDISLTVDIGRASLAGIDIKGVSGTFKLDPEGVTFDRVRIADLADAAFSLNGRMEGALDAPRGTVTFDVDARGLDGTVAVLSNYLPQAAEPLRQTAGKIVPLKARATLGIEPVSSTDPRGASKVKLALDGSAGALRMKIGTEASGDIGALALPEFRLDGNVSATDGTALVSLLGLDRVLTVDKRAGTLTVAIRSAAGSDARVDARLNAGGLAASATGTARLFHADGLATALDLSLQASDAGPLRRGTVTPNTLLPVAVRAKLNATANELALENISGAVGGSPVRGALKLALGAPKRVTGQIEADAIDVPALLAAGAGMPRIAARADAPPWAAEPFGESALGGIEGNIAFTATRATLTPALVGRQVRGTLRIDPREVTIEASEGTLAGGRATGHVTLSRSPEGLATRARINLANADAAQLLANEGKAAVNGRVAFNAEVEGSGLSPASLIGSLKGAGTIVLEDAQITGLDPKAFNAAVRSVDQGVALDARKVQDITTTVLDGGALTIPRLDAVMAINAGQARVAQTTAYGLGADLMLGGVADLADASIDARLSLLGPVISEGTNSIRPEIFVSLKGPIATPRRTIDISALSAWLTLRAVERQSKRIDAIEQERAAVERREAERREAERREAERRESERRDAEASAATSTVPAALPSTPSIMVEEAVPAAPNAAPSRPARPKQPANAQSAPALPPPMNIGPPPGAQRPARPPGAASAPPQPRSAFEALFGLQR